MTGLTGLTVVVVGLGPMGRGIARIFAAAGAATTVVDRDEPTTVAGARTLQTEAEVDGVPVTVRPVADLATAVAGADLLIEAVVEDPTVKEELLTRLAKVAGPELVVASNTSSLSISELGRVFGDPTRVVGMHFFNPPTKMRLVEVVRGARTADAVVAQAVAWSRALGKTPVVCTDSPNFVVNRICRPLYYEAQLLVSQGVPAGVVDAVARGALGHRMGPLELLDFTGLHTHLGSSQTAYREFGDPRYRPIPLVKALVRAGATGRAAGVGFYDYQQEKPSAARARLTTPAPPPDGTKLRLAGPDAAPLRADERIAAVVDDTAPLVLYRSLAAGDQQHLAEVAALRAAGATVVVDSSAGDWLETLPPGVGWLRLHTPPAGPFAEVVDDPVAGIHPTPGVERVLAAVGAASVRVPALPGLVADRLAHCLINEAVLVVEEGTADPEAVDTALRLGMNHPVGPLELLAQHGPAQVYTSLCGMLRWLGDPRYRPTPLLRRQAAGARRTAAVGA
ncbi:MAG TPA: 3-hydroxyacyl-CoA dehydrogenase NAD-binding domain-containing protein [Natronosporangium sp.]|nr:3-hydroxyacyl-CoA dehydrogenase NAD-binding domain-containing protein [Natronosporangium sp.]